MSHIRYFIYLTRHRFYVFIECCRRGIPWLGITHDLSKFRPDEWFAYARHFFGGGDPGSFDHAWTFHQGRNKHHWQHWTATFSPLRCLAHGSSVSPMPRRYALEMVCDWLAMSRAKGADSAIPWYIKNKDEIILHDSTRRFVEIELGVRVAIPRPESSRAGDPS